MSELLKKYRNPIGILAVLLLANLMVHWPSKKNPQRETGSGAPLFTGEMPEEMRSQFDDALKKLPEDQKVALKKRMAEEHSFFDSIKGLPDEERDRKIHEHFERNPPPAIPGLPMPPLPGTVSAEGGNPGNVPPGAAGQSGSGGRKGKGGPWSGHIPPPEMRRTWDQNIATSQEKDHTL